MPSSIALAIPLALSTAIITVGAPATLLLKPCIDNTIVVIGVLEIVLCQHAITRGRGVARHQQIFVQELLGITSHTIAVAAIVVRIAALWALLAAAAAALAALHVVLLVHPKIEPSERNPLCETTTLSGRRGIVTTTAQLVLEFAHKAVTRPLLNSESHGVLVSDLAPVNGQRSRALRPNASMLFSLAGFSNIFFSHFAMF